MSRSSYSRMNCFVCGKEMSSNGLARTNHFRKHVREGKMREVVVNIKSYPYRYHTFEVVLKGEHKEVYGEK